MFRAVAPPGVPRPGPVPPPLVGVSAAEEFVMTYCARSQQKLVKGCCVSLLASIATNQCDSVVPLCLVVTCHFHFILACWASPSIVPFSISSRGCSCSAAARRPNFKAVTLAGYVTFKLSNIVSNGYMQTGRRHPPPRNFNPAGRMTKMTY